MKIVESIPSKHYLERKNERTELIGITIDDSIYEKYGAQQVNSLLKGEIESQIKKVLRAIETRVSTKEVDKKSPIYKSFKILKPEVLFQGNSYPVNMEVLATKENVPGKVKEKGDAFAVISAGDTLITFMLISDERDLLQQSREHLKRKKGVDLDTIKLTAVNAINYQYVIDIDKLINGAPKQEKISKESLPYTIRTDYRKGAYFTHEKYGKGIIVNTSAGVKGQPNTQGKLDWVEVAFERPILKSGVLHKTLKFPNIYATTYWI
jgi:hypothetical protein